ncbi:MAG: hypothetical protein J6X78_01745, partial [Treponema sp.]|nr:hypothetical protein [Treponema sp.]
VSDLGLMFKVDDKIDSICVIDREYKETQALAEQAKDRAQTALTAADEASKKSAGFGKKKKAIEALQAAQKEQSLATETNTQAITKLAELQERIIEATKALFALGISNVAANRSVYRQLELRMKGASEQELSDFARNEVMAVMQQLNEQQDMMARHNKLSEKVHEQNDLLKNQASAIEALELQSKNQKAEIEKLKLQNEKQKEQVQAYIKAQLDKLQKEDAESEDHEPDEDAADKNESFAADAEAEEWAEPAKEKSGWFQKKR